jgi:hypothetical protein
MTKARPLLSTQPKMASVWDWTQISTWRYIGVEVNLQTFLTSTLDKVWLSASCCSSTKGVRSFHCLRSENIIQDTLAITLLTAPSKPQLKVTVHEFDIHGSMHCNIFLQSNQQVTPVSPIIYSCKTLYTFWTVFPSIIRSSRLHI